MRCSLFKTISHASFHSYSPSYGRTINAPLHPFESLHSQGLALYRLLAFPSHVGSPQTKGFGKSAELDNLGIQLPNRRERALSSYWLGPGDDGLESRIAEDDRRSEKRPEGQRRPLTDISDAVDHLDKKGLGCIELWVQSIEYHFGIDTEDIPRVSYVVPR